GFDDLRVWELLPEAADGGLHGLAEGVGVLVPDLLEQLLCADRDWAGGEERFEHTEFLGREVELSSLAVSGACDGVEFDSGRAQGSPLGGGFATGKRADPEHEFREVERLGKVVVGTEPEARDTL